MATTFHYPGLISPGPRMLVLHAHGLPPSSWGGVFLLGKKQKEECPKWEWVMWSHPLLAKLRVTPAWLVCVCVCNPIWANGVNVVCSRVRTVPALWVFWLLRGSLENKPESMRAVPTNWKFADVCTTINSLPPHSKNSPKTIKAVDLSSTSVKAALKEFANDSFWMALYELFYFYCWSRKRNGLWNTVRLRIDLGAPFRCY